ncbi:hypothetical protein BD749_0678 [Pontibacter ramchanderi]|uniref:Uncharacterized protein n=1 Tax=Pontibacter ramchanderi TaxID=1179743 RepID=A0A2N3V285_9BACT|nr:hypothetical protein BD749_0678 [Pontibacter ramchanderi]
MYGKYRNQSRLLEKLLLFQPVKDDLVNGRHGLSVLIGKPHHFFYFTGSGDRAGIGTGIAGHLHLHPIRMAIGLRLKYTQKPGAVLDQGNAEFFVYFPRQRLEIALTCFAFSAGEIVFGSSLAAGAQYFAVPDFDPGSLSMICMGGIILLLSLARLKKQQMVGLTLFLCYVFLKA